MHKTKRLIARVLLILMLCTICNWSVFFMHVDAAANPVTMLIDVFEKDYVEFSSKLDNSSIKAMRRSSIFLLQGIIDTDAWILTRGDNFSKAYMTALLIAGGTYQPGKYITTNEFSENNALSTDGVTSAFVPLYSGSSDKQIEAVAISGVSYNCNDGYYYYYMIAINKALFSKASVSAQIFKSDTLYSFNWYFTIGGTSGSSSSLRETKKLNDTNHTFDKSDFNAILSNIVSDGADDFIIELDSSNRISNLLSAEVTENNTIKTKINWYSEDNSSGKTIQDIFVKNTTNLNFDIKESSEKHNYKLDNSILYAEIGFDNNYLDWAEAQALVKNTSDIDAIPLAEFIAKIISVYIKQKQTNPNFKGYTSDYYKTVIDTFNDSINARMQEYNLTKQFEQAVNKQKSASALEGENEFEVLSNYLLISTKGQLKEFKSYKTNLKDSDGLAIYIYTNFSTSTWSSTGLSDKVLEDLQKNGGTTKTCKYMTPNQLFYQLNDYQRASLSTMYRLLIGNSCNLVSIPTLENTSFQLDVSKASSISVSYNGVDADVAESAQKICKNFKSNMTGSILNVAEYCYEMGVYSFYNSLYGAREEDDIDVYAVYNSDLNSLLDLEFSSLQDPNYIPVTLPEDIGALGQNSEAFTNMLSISNGEQLYWDTYINLLYNISHAFAIMNGSQAGQESYYTSDQLEEQLNKWIEAAGSNVNNFDFTGTSFDQNISIGCVRAVISLHNFCDYFKIDPSKWTKDIEKYYDLYSLAVVFADNYHIKSASSLQADIDREPLQKFFLVEDKKMSENWKIGFALSALYVPMETNLYDASAVAWLNNSNWVSEYYYKYGFYRKALYIATDNSSVVNQYMTGELSSTRLATLGDLLKYDRDIMLYVDDNFYNANEVSDIVSKLDYTAIRNTADSGSVTQSLGNWIGELFNLDAPTVLKTGASQYYSNTLATKCTQLGEEPKWITSYIDAYLLSEQDMKNYLDESEYTVKQSYSVVTAIYRCNILFNELLRGKVADGAIFKSSPALAELNGTKEEDWLTYMNYVMLSNLELAMKSDAASTLDLDSPIFCDVFGNIVTESGIVIIPAASNATLAGTDWSPCTLAFATLYNQGNKIKSGFGTADFNEWLTGITKSVEPIYSEDDEEEFIRYQEVEHKSTKYNENHALGSNWFIENDYGEYLLKTSVVSSGKYACTIQWNIISRNSSYIKQVFYNKALYDISGNMYSPALANNIVEVLRGAPIEAIDYTYEGLDGLTSISKFGVYTAYKLEELINNLISGTNGSNLKSNSLFTMPNLAFVSGIEYIMLYVYKIIFALLIVGLVIQLFLDATRNSISLKTIAKFSITVIGVIVAITFVPDLINTTYYGANKSLLTDEVGYIAMLNYAKEFDGAEVGVTSVETPETETELYLKLDNVEVEWWTIVNKVLFENTRETLTELYAEEFSKNSMAKEKDVVQKANGLYLNVNDILDQTKLAYSTTYNKLRVMSSDEYGSTASYVLPYYVILQQLTENVNYYNAENSIESYSYKVASNGHVVTYDAISPYLISDLFMDEGYDILGFNKLTKAGLGTVDTTNPFSTSDIENMTASLWWVDEDYSINERKEGVQQLERFARNWIADNRSLLGKVPDEVFLKIFALQLAIKYNNVFRIPAGKSIEIMNIDSRDLMRLLVGTRENVYKNYSYTLARYVYEESGTIGVVFSAMFIVIVWITSWIKPLFMIIIVSLLIISAIGRKLLFRKDNHAVEGYLIACACLAGCNYVYALMLKTTLNLANLGIGTIASFLMAFIVQIVYIISLIILIGFEVKDWKNAGFNEFAKIGNAIGSSIVNIERKLNNNYTSHLSPEYRDSLKKRKNVTRFNMTGRQLLNEMYEKDEYRYEDGINNITQRRMI